MAYKFDDVKDGYTELYKTMKPNALGQKLATGIAATLVDHKDRYQKVADETGVPWWAIATIHEMEADGSFQKHLHNGDPLNRRTIHVPRNRPPLVTWTWEESAIDAIRYQKLDKVKDWTTERVLYVLEDFNGWGYRPKKINTPYLWSMTNHYTKGKYIADNKFSSTTVSKQVGGAIILKALLANYV